MLASTGQFATPGATAPQTIMWLAVLKAHEELLKPSPLVEKVASKMPDEGINFSKLPTSSVTSMM